MVHITPTFIFIDDDLVSNSICRRTIKKMLPEAEVHIFNDPEAGLEFIRSGYTVPGAKRAILFLDINMPTLTGWDVLDELKKYADAVKQNIKIFILSSSIDVRDRQKASDNSFVSDCIEKPLTKLLVNSILHDSQRVESDLTDLQAR